MPKFYKPPYYTEEVINSIEEENMQFPFSDKYMKYDSIKRQYIPTRELLTENNIDLTGFLESTGNLNAVNENKELEYISDQVYNYIYKKSGSNIETLKWIVAKGVRRGISPFRFRLIFQEILCKQAQYYVNNDDLTKTSGVDIEQKNYLNKGVLYNEDRNIAPQVKTMLMNLGLTYVRSYDYQFASFVVREDW